MWYNLIKHFESNVSWKCIFLLLFFIDVYHYEQCSIIYILETLDDFIKLCVNLVKWNSQTNENDASQTIQMTTRQNVLNFLKNTFPKMIHAESLITLANFLPVAEPLL